MKINFSIILVTLFLVVLAIGTNGIPPAEDGMNGNNAREGSVGTRSFSCDSNAPTVSCINWPEGRGCRCGSACYGGVCRCQKCI